MTGQLELKRIVYNIFFKLMVLLAIHGRFWSFCFHCLLSALLCGSNMCTQVSSPVSKLEITRLLQPLYVFKSSWTHLRHCISCSSVSKCGTHLAQTFLRSKRFFRIVCTLPSDAGLGGSVGCAVRLETWRSRVQPPPRSATFFLGDWSWNIFYGHSLPSADSRRAVVSFWRKNVHSSG